MPRRGKPPTGWPIAGHRGGSACRQCLHRFGRGPAGRSHSRQVSGNSADGSRAHVSHPCILTVPGSVTHDRWVTKPSQANQAATPHGPFPMGAPRAPIHFTRLNDSERTLLSPRRQLRAAFAYSPREQSPGEPPAPADSQGARHGGPRSGQESGAAPGRPGCSSLRQRCLAAATGGQRAHGAPAAGTLSTGTHPRCGCRYRNLLQAADAALSSGAGHFRGFFPGHAARRPWPWSPMVFQTHPGCGRRRGSAAGRQQRRPAGVQSDVTQLPDAGRRSAGVPSRLETRWATDVLQLGPRHTA